MGGYISATPREAETSSSTRVITSKKCQELMGVGEWSSIMLTNVQEKSSTDGAQPFWLMMGALTISSSCIKTQFLTWLYIELERYFGHRVRVLWSTVSDEYRVPMFYHRCGTLRRKSARSMRIRLDTGRVGIRRCIPICCVRSFDESSRWTMEMQGMWEEISRRQIGLGRQNAI